jgi:Secretion system C-terminal sorting domain
MKPISTQKGKRSIMRIAIISFFLAASLLSTYTVAAHTVQYYTPPCITAGQQVTIPVKVVFANSGTWYHWQYRLNNGAPGAWTFLSNGNNTINGTVFAVTNASLKTNVADSCASLKINNATTALNGIELRVLMGDNADPQVVTTPVWGGSDQALGEVKMVRITVKPATENCFSGCTDNMLVLTPPATLNTPLSQFYGGFEAGSSNFGGTNANGSSVSAQTDITQWTSGSLSNNPRYRVTNNADSVNSSFSPFAPHSGRQQLIVSRSANSNTRVWYKTIVANTTPTQNYYFNTGSMKAWVAKADGGANPTIVLEIVGTNNSNNTVVLASTTFTFTTQAAGQWVQVSVADVNVTVNTYKKLEYRIRNTNTTANSFALDDICVISPQAGTLPVTLTALTGKYANGIANLNWGTQQESNSSHFEIERSNNGSNFSSIGKVAAAGSSNFERTYRFNDIKVNNGVNYYRLKAVDKDGSYSYSNTVALQVSIKGISITGIYPSPFVDKVNIALAAETNTIATLRLLDNTGRQLRLQTNAINKGLNNLSFNNLGSLAKGLYLVEVIIDGAVQSQKIIKQ